MDLIEIYDSLYSYCRSRDFAGKDPFDGLSSPIFQALPLRRSRIARLAWLQMIKRSAIDLRPLAGISSGVNPKALALFALAETSRFRVTGHADHQSEALGLLGRLNGSAITGVCPGGGDWSAFAYDFDWQSRTFYAPRGTPAIVPCAFASQALIEGYSYLAESSYFQTADRICRFILCRLNRYAEADDEVCFSYTPIDETRIFNANLLAGECLARVGAITGNTEYLEWAAKTVRYAVRRQRIDGAWTYGEEGVQAWADNFHTAYILVSLERIAAAGGPEIPDVVSALDRGITYWLDNFFLSDGTPRYYDRETYPVDIHSAAVAIAYLCELKHRDCRALPTARKVAEWTISHLRDPDGHFYYQVRKTGTVKTSFMRWGQAWMAFAIARLIEAGG